MLPHRNVYLNGSSFFFLFLFLVFFCFVTVCYLVFHQKLPVWCGDGGGGGNKEVIISVKSKGPIKSKHKKTTRKKFGLELQGSEIWNMILLQVCDTHLIYSKDSYLWTSQFNYQTVSLLKYSVSVMTYGYPDLANSRVACRSCVQKTGNMKYSSKRFINCSFFFISNAQNWGSHKLIEL